MTGGISIYPMVRKDRINKMGLTSLTIRVDLNSSPVAYDKMGDKAPKIPIQYWNDVTKSLDGAYPNSREINIKIRNRVLELEREFLRLEIQGMPITKQVIKDIVDGTEGSRSFYKYCEKRIDHLSSEFAPLTIKRFKSEIEKLTRHRPDVSFGDITPDFLVSYDSYMRTVLKNTSNTVGKTMKFIGRMLNDAIRDKYIKDNPFNVYKIPTYRKPEKKYLELVEILAIEKLLYDDTVEFNTRATAAFFLCECLCGSRHSDWGKLKDIDLQKDYFLFTTQKTRTDVSFPIGTTLRRVLDIIQEKKYSPLSLQKSNDHLKVIALMAKIKKPLSTHVGRHTFGYNCAKLRIPKSVTAQLMGVTDATVETYYHLAGETISIHASPLKDL